MTVAIVRFPGSNCFRDSMHVIQNAVGAKAVEVWHQEAELPSGTQSVFLPGGFSYGDYLRCGAMAAHQPIMAAVKEFAEKAVRFWGLQRVSNHVKWAFCRVPDAKSPRTVRLRRGGPEMPAHCFCGGTKPKNPSNFRWHTTTGTTSPVTRSWICWSARTGSLFGTRNGMPRATGF